MATEAPWRGRLEQLTGWLVELLQLERELLEREYVRRADGLESISEALRHLGEVGSSAGVIARAADELGARSEFSRVVVSRIDNEWLRPLVAWTAEESVDAKASVADLVSRAMPLRYPLVEAEVAQQRDPRLVRISDSGPRVLPELAEALQWGDVYAVAAIVLGGQAVGLLHADRLEGPPLDDVDLDLLALYAEGLGQCFERATLREQLQRQSANLQVAAQWINGQMARLAIGQTPTSEPDLAVGDSDLGALLTRREHEVLKLIARGQSNRAIAATLMLGEGTVKYHVRNVLRKLQARTRTDAVSRYMRLSSEENRP